MNKFIATVFIILSVPLSADVFYTPSQYNSVYNEKVALEIEISRLKRQYQNDKKSQESEIKSLKERIEVLEKYLALEKEGRQSDKDGLLSQIEELKNRIEILKGQSSSRERNLIDQNSRLEKDYQEQIEKLKNQLEEEKKSCLARIEALNQDFARKQSDYEKQISELQNELAELKKLTASQKAELDRLSNQAGELEKQLTEEIKSGQIRLKRMFNKIVINIDDKISFDSGSAELKPEIKNALVKISDILASYPENNLVVEGHTDNIPIKTAKFRDNWQLSSERALAVLAFLLKSGKINPVKTGIAGYGEFQPLVPNDTPQNRSLNRRVDIVVVPRITPGNSQQ